MGLVNMEKKKICIVFNPQNKGENRRRKALNQIKVKKRDMGNVKKPSFVSCSVKKDTDLQKAEAIEKYKNFFVAYRVPTELLQRLFVEYKAIAMLQRNYVEIRCHEDTWRIFKGAGNEEVELWHNNYVRRFCGERYFVEGYHKQRIPDKTLAGALVYIMDYDYNKHHTPEKIFTRNIKKVFEEEFEKVFEERRGGYGIL